MGKEIPGSTNPQEATPKVDFKALFDQKLESIESIPQEDQEDWASWYGALNIKKLKREIPALVFRPSTTESDLEVWIDNPSNVIRPDQPHDQLRNQLSSLLGRNMDFDYGNEIGARILQDSKGKLYLVVDEMRAEWIIRGLNDNQEKSTALLDLLRKYKIEKVAGQFYRVARKVNQQAVEQKPKLLSVKTCLAKDEKSFSILILLAGII